MSDTAKGLGFTTASQQIVGKPTPTPSGQNQVCRYHRRLPLRLWEVERRRCVRGFAAWMPRSLPSASRTATGSMFAVALRSHRRSR
ncbi:hypothetical protein D3M70_17345 [Pseudomonas sp. LS-2]|nr:hypothetical protein D3M70_17345 [Pseudomonas sp. LS-2]